MANRNAAFAGTYATPRDTSGQTDLLCKQEVASSIPAGSTGRKVLQIPSFLAYGDQGDDRSGGEPGCMRGALGSWQRAPLLRLAPERRLRVRLRVLLTEAMSGCVIS